MRDNSTISVSQSNKKYLNQLKYSSNLATINDVITILLKPLRDKEGRADEPSR